jgi:RimJ/RimL family protein N-acetyltransferase
VVSGPDADGKLIVYNSGISRVRDEEELPGCFDESPGDDRTALFRIDVIEIPVDNPAASRIIDSPTVFADPETGALAGLWRGGDHGEDTQETSRTDECHDITVFPSLNLAAGACSGNGILFDITDPRAPERIDAVSDSGFAYWHSATFNNDGSKVLFTDEWGGGTRPRCRTYDPLTWGADAIYDIVDGRLVFRSHFKMPAPQGETENCVAHNGSIIPVPGRDIFVQAWYQGGLSIIDFTDSANPIEIAYFDRGPIDDTDLVTGGYWSTYWYQGRIYGTEIIRGIDVFALVPSEHLSANEIAAAEMANQGRLFNPQQQFPVTWPPEPTVSLAYLDQWLRAHPGRRQTLGALYETLHAATTILKNKGQDAALAASLADWANTTELSTATALRESLRAISRRLSVGPPTRLISQSAP